MGEILLIWPYFDYAMFCNVRSHKTVTIVLQQDWLYIKGLSKYLISKHLASVFHRPGTRACGIVSLLSTLF